MDDAILQLSLRKKYLQHIPKWSGQIRKGEEEEKIMASVMGIVAMAVIIGAYEASGIKNN